MTGKKVNASQLQTIFDLYIKYSEMGNNPNNDWNIRKKYNHMATGIYKAVCAMGLGDMLYSYEIEKYNKK